MQTTKMSRAVAGAICAVAATLLAGPTQAALQDRDLNRDSVVDAFYDTDLDITWLRDADVNSVMTAYDAVTWADGFSFGGYTDWRLPTSDSCYGYNCTGSEMGHLWYVELGNSAGTLTNTGEFLNLRAFPVDKPNNWYWSGTEDVAYPGWTYAFVMVNGGQGSVIQLGLGFAMAVRDGDVPSVPEPQTYALLALGLAGLAGRIRQHQR